MRISSSARLRAFIVAAGALAVWLAGGPLHAQPVVNQIVASVDGEPITIYDLKEFSEAQGNPLPDDKAPGALAAKREALKGLIAEKLMEEELKNFEDKVDDASVDRYIAKIEEKAHLSDSEFRSELARRGMSYDEYRRRARMEIEKMEMLDKHVREKVTIAPDQIAAYYKAHPKDFTITRERLKLAQIMIAIDPKSPSAKVDAARAKIEDLRKRALKGEDFAELARKYSDDDSKSRGGELGYFSPDDIMDQIKVAVIKLNRGQISEVVESRHGFHVVKVEEHERPGLRPLDQVRDDIREKLSEDQMEVQLKRWLDQELIKGHHVESYL